jgi:hypothetical protein
MICTWQGEAQVLLVHDYMMKKGSNSMVRAYSERARKLSSGP